MWGRSAEGSARGVRGGPSSPPTQHWLVAQASGSHLKMSSSTLIETVSLNYDDFNESFLTCATCLCAYDGRHHRPKLLSCSHTVCASCLERIITLPSANEGFFRCPICRESLPIPGDGVHSLPPSFLVNQLIDLMQRQRRDIVPRCSSHQAEELLFCETCDTVFCPSCSDPSNVNSACHNHTIVPFSIAIKRMSEILLYKANQCVKNLDRAAVNVQNEMDSLDNNVDQIMDKVAASFQELDQLLQKRKKSIVEDVRRVRDEKRKVLQDQLGIIQAEKAKVEQECEGLEYQVEVRSITQKISDLNQKLDTTLTLIDPRENSFVRYESSSSGDVLKGLQGALSQFGSLSVSRTFPPLCTATPLPASVLTQSTVLLHTIDYNGQRRTSGGDPIQALLIPWDENSSLPPLPQSQPGLDPFIVSSPQTLPVHVEDHGDGTYSLNYNAPSHGQYRMDVRIFQRPIKSSPVLMEVSPHHNPVWQFGSAGSDTYHLRQPVRVLCGPLGQIYILDTGNNRLKVLTCDGNVMRHISGDAMAQQSAVGLALLWDRSQLPGTQHDERTVSGFLTLNWRSRSVTEWSMETGRETRTFSFSEFVEPIDLAVDSRGRVLVADNGARKVFIFDALARPLLSFPVNARSNANPETASTLPRGFLTPSKQAINGSPSKYSTISSASQLHNSHHPAPGMRIGNGLSPKQQQTHTLTSIGVGMNDDILVGGSDGIQIYDSLGNFVRRVSVLDPSSAHPNGGRHGLVVGGISTDSKTGTIVSTVIDRNKTFIAVSHYKGGFHFAIDSHSSKLKRPSGICITDDSHCIVADLGNHCVKKFRFK